MYSYVILQFLSDFYIDNSITGKQTEEEAFDFYLVYKSLMKEGGCNLQKWMSNSKSLREKIAHYESKYFGESASVNREEDDELVFHIRDLKWVSIYSRPYIPILQTVCKNISMKNVIKCIKAVKYQILNQLNAMT